MIYFKILSSSKQSKEFFFEARRWNVGWCDKRLPATGLLFVILRTVGDTCKCSICLPLFYLLCHYMKMNTFIRIRTTIDGSNFDLSKWNDGTDLFYITKQINPWSFELNSNLSKLLISRSKTWICYHNFIHTSFQVYHVIYQKSKYY